MYLLKHLRLTLPQNSVHILCIGLLCIGLLQPFKGVSQTVIQEFELEDYYDDNGIYPFEYHSGNMEMIYQRHRPVVKLSENEFIHIWRPKELNSRIRAFTRYNLLLDSVWCKEIELRDDEEIAHVYADRENLHIVTFEYDHRQDEYRVLHRKLALEDGKEFDTKILSVIKDTKEIPLFLESVEGDSLFVIYYYRNLVDRKSVRYYYDHQQKEDDLGVRAQRVCNVVFDIYTCQGVRVSNDTLNISHNPKNKIDVLSGQLDRRGNFYLTTLERDQYLTIYQYNRATEKVDSLTYPDFPRYWREDDIYNTHLPPKIEGDGRLYIAFCKRDKMKRVGMQIQSIHVLRFDFKQKEIDASRQLTTDSSVLVDVSKAREKAGLKPITKFDRYLIRDMIIKPDASLLLLLQKFDQENRMNSTLSRPFMFFSPVSQGAPMTILEEIVIFEFTPLGDFSRTLIVPSYQRVRVAIEMMGHFFSVMPDWEANQLQFLVHENGGEKYSEPMRLYYKTLDLSDGQTSERVQIFDHRKRNHYYSRPHTTWLNEHVVATLMFVNSSISTQTYWVSHSLP